ncbi:class I SAM-dependent methyltransferase [Siccirubricoccus sp. KC 17139]|uniref:Class I SAM-dependent methyltransferase n=1 Tax=Siccirubricoccus soli TaxID=2899147 RepID=A0ABT1D4M5_9PROT|nr:class I SAM-dependent methyltransferase [Siccirubricoccus soli]MCO6416866.1 class I SAM-dependent methyltransferase [Siccirubricoccus soli]MCP2683001.1 class I SAM-dependent methyltransferase [Siccirubricoccus soli]
MQIITTLGELDEKIAECNRAEAISDDAMRAVFGTFRMEPPWDLPADPLSDAYRQAQMALYCRIAGRDYALGNEATPFDIEAAIRRPFPFSTASGVTTGDYFMAIGALLRAMALPPSSRVIEFGPGWGHTTLMLAKLGHRVTAVDIEPRFCELIRRRAAMEGLEIEVVNDDFLWVEKARDRFDAALFFECFHHCADHLRLLQALGPALTPEARIFFAAEPIQPEFPMPWGLRLDGNSLWAIRKNGWLELGFREEYFRQALRRTGWFGLKLPCREPGWMTLWEARRLGQPVFRAAGADPRINTAIGERTGRGIVLAAKAPGTGLYGPYIALPAGHYRAMIRFARNDAPRGAARMDVAAHAGNAILATRALDGMIMASGDGAVTLPFSSEADLDQVEVRLFCDPGFQGVIEAVEIAPDPVFPW